MASGQIDYQHDGDFNIQTLSQDGGDWFGDNAPQQPSGGTFGNAAYDQVAAIFRQYAHREPTQAEVSQWGTNIDANYLNAIRTQIARQYGTAAPASPTPTAAPTQVGGSDPEGFRKAWFESGGTNVTDLANFVKAHPEFGATITGSKGSKVTFAGGQAYQAVRSAGINGGIGAAWDDLSQQNAAPQGGFTPPAGSQLPDFVAPTGATEQNDPGYAFRLQQGEQALQRAQSASGTSHTGGAVKDLTAFDQNYASNEFGNVYNRALQDYGTKYGKANDIYQRGASEYDRKFGNLFSLSQLDSQNNNAYNANQLGWAGLSANVGMNGANAYGNYLGQGANANAAGTIGQSNAWNSLFSSIPRSALDAYYASQYGRTTRAGTGAGGGTSSGVLPGTY